MEQKMLPSIADVIIKVKNRQELTAEEEFVYLVEIEKLPEAEAQKIINNETGE